MPGGHVSAGLLVWDWAPPSAPDSRCLLRELVQFCLFSVPSLCHRTFCASLTPAAAVALAALSLCSSLLHHVAPKRRAEVDFDESEFRFRCAAILTLLAAFSPVWPQTDHPLSPCCLGLPRLCCVPPTVLRSGLCVCWIVFSAVWGGVVYSRGFWWDEIASGPNL